MRLAHPDNEWQSSTGLNEDTLFTVRFQFPFEITLVSFVVESKRRLQTKPLGIAQRILPARPKMVKTTSLKHGMERSLGNWVSIQMVGNEEADPTPPSFFIHELDPSFERNTKSWPCVQNLLMKTTFSVKRPSFLSESVF